jgi:hypothetical protein
MLHLERGFDHMYNLRFEAADRVLAEWKAKFPSDPRGPVSEAAASLFSELNRLGILEAQFFTDDSAFESRPSASPDLAVRERFYERLNRAEKLAGLALEQNPEEVHALFAMALVHGLKADYAALVKKENMASLRHTRQASEWAEKLLQIAPDYYDAYLATGISNYIIGSLAAPIRWLLRLGGYKGNREKGLRHLELTARHGRLLGPFARMLLAITELRSGNRARARELLVTLRDDFPSNSLFAREIARIDSGRH